MPTKITKKTKTTKTAKPTKTTKAIKTVKSTKTSKAAKPAKATLDARESNRLRQQRFLENHRDEINEKRRDRYAERKDSGCCPRCGKKLRSAKFTLCKDCLEKARDYNQR